MTPEEALGLAATHLYEAAGHFVRRRDRCERDAQAAGARGDAARAAEHFIEARTNDNAAGHLMERAAALVLFEGAAVDKKIREHLDVTWMMVESGAGREGWPETLFPGEDR